MLRIVLDTNVLISGLLHAGKSKELVDEALEGRVLILCSRQILSEFERVISREKFKLTKKQQLTIFQFVNRLPRHVKVRSRFKVIKEDLTDNMILNCAYDGRADYIVSGDKHLLNLKEFKGVKILSVAGILEILTKETPR